MQPVPEPNLGEIIKALEKEKRALQKMIKEAARELDNLIVYYHSEALIQINARLDKLYAFRDPLYNQKNELKRRIEYFKHYHEPVSSRKKYLKKHIDGMLLKFKLELKNLESKQPIPPKQVSLNIIDEALLKLYSSQCKSFRLSLGDVDNDSSITLIFKKNKKQLLVQFKGKLFEYEPDFILDGRPPTPLKAPEMVYDPGLNIYFRKLNFSDIQNIKDATIWLAKFVIDDNRFYYPGQKMMLKYYGLKT